jgi:TetR/AcrR family transcriptional regulator, repressor for uid operon
MRKVDPVKHEEKRQEILEAAGRCFARDGLQGASISDICAEAKISPGHLYHYFASKEAIVAAMVEGGLEAASERFSQIVDSPDVLAAFASEVQQTKARPDRAGRVLLLDMLAEAERNPALAKVLQEHSRNVRRFLAEFIRRGQARGQIDPSLEPDLTAAILISVFDGLKTLSIRDPKIDAKKSTKLLTTLITRFLTPPQAGP